MGDKSIGQFILANNKWKNIVYDFNGHSNNCTLNVFIENPVVNFILSYIKLIMLISDKIY